MPFFESVITTMAQNLFGYLDPSAGSMGFQLILAGLLSGMFFFRTLLHTAKQRIIGLRIRVK